MLVPKLERVTLGSITHRYLAQTGLAIFVILALAGCGGGRSLMPTPVLYTLGEFKPFDNLPDTYQTTNIDMLFVTDRQPASTDNGNLSYGIGRSNSVAFGAARVDVTSSVSFKELKNDAQTVQRTQPLELTLAAVKELGRAPPTPIPWMEVDGVPVPDPEIDEMQHQTAAAFHAELMRRFELTGRKEVFLYIHGIQTTFADSVFAMSELWHYLGREGVPIAYTWPAGGGGILRGYTRDRESGEFTIYHLKGMIRLLASFPEVKGLHIIAHSRGTDVTVTALRELMIEIRARNGNVLEELKVRNLVLAAPDLDLSVTLQRAAAERIGAGVGRLTIYTSPNDKAISVAEFLFGGLIRLGQLNLVNVAPDLLRATATVGKNIAIIEYTGSRSDSFGHSYFRENPAVASDLILALRYDRDPGAENGRPLKRTGEIFWLIDDDYLDDKKQSSHQ